MFRTKFKHFEYLILLFGFTNVLVIFQVMINYVLKDFIDKIIVVYLNNIFIFSKILEEYKKYIHFVLTILE